MKKIIYILLLISFFSLSNKVLAETFYEGDYLNIYVNKKKNNKTYYLNMQTLINRDTNKYVYCLEPFEFFNTNAIYEVFEEDFSNYKLTDKQLERIHKLTNYGYGYKHKNRNELKWYAITQVLIWRTIDPDADIYFTNTLNGTRNDSMFQEEIKELEEDVNRNGIRLPSTLTVPYDKNASIGVTSDYIEVISSDYPYTLTDGLYIKNVKEDGKITLRTTNYNNGINKIFSSIGNQDIIIPGYQSSDIKTINLDVLKASIILDIRKYSGNIYNEAIFTNTCYGLYKNNSFIRKICANDNLITKIDNLELGKYTIRQLSNGTGYIKDNTIYEVELSNDNEEKTVILNNNIITNNLKIVKKYCFTNICSYEENAIFNILGSEDNLVGTYKTDNKGELTIELGYGNYNIVQIEGKEGYELIEPFLIEITNNNNPFYFELYDNEIVKEELKEPIIIEPVDPIEPVILEPEPVEPVIEDPKEEPPKEDDPVEEPLVIEEQPVIEPAKEQKTILEKLEEEKEEPIIEQLMVKEETPITDILFQDIPPSTWVKEVKKVVKVVWNFIVDNIRKYKYVIVLL